MAFGHPPAQRAQGARGQMRLFSGAASSKVQIPVLAYQSADLKPCSWHGSSLKKRNICLQLPSGARGTGCSRSRDLPGTSRAGPWVPVCGWVSLCPQLPPPSRAVLCSLSLRSRPRRDRRSQEPHPHTGQSWMYPDVQDGVQSVPKTPATPSLCQRLSNPVKPLGKHASASSLILTRWSNFPKPAADFQQQGML